MWRRSLLQQANTVDTTTLVLWIQTEQYHVDIRIPASRPILDSVNQLEDYTTEQLTFLTNQQGFTGITQVSGNHAEWLREFDYQPLSSQRDIGEMHFESDSILIENGVDADYLERWVKVPNSHLNLSMKHLAVKDRHSKKVPARLFTSNNTFAYVRPRSRQMPAAESIAAAIDYYQPTKDVLLDWLDFEISFGEIIDKNHGGITHSTHPFREGATFKFNE
jgi:hypothetical protein